MDVEKGELETGSVPHYLFSSTATDTHRDGVCSTEPQFHERGRTYVSSLSCQGGHGSQRSQTCCLCRA